jgi:hypothetical protein
MPKYQINGHTIERVEGRDVQPIALCGSPEIAAEIINAIAAHETLCALLNCASISERWATKARSRIEQHGAVQ